MLDRAKHYCELIKMYVYALHRNKLINIQTINRNSKEYEYYRRTIGKCRFVKFRIEEDRSINLIYNDYHFDFINYWF